MKLATLFLRYRLLYLLIAKNKHCQMNIDWYNEKMENYCNIILWEMRIIENLEFPALLNDLVLEHSIYLRIFL